MGRKRNMSTLHTPPEKVILNGEEHPSIRKKEYIHNRILNNGTRNEHTHKIRYILVGAIVRTLLHFELIAMRSKGHPIKTLHKEK